MPERAGATAGKVLLRVTEPARGGQRHRKYRGTCGEKESGDRNIEDAFRNGLGECEGSLLLSDERAAVEVSIYFCRLSFQGPDWQLFLEPESHSLLL